MPVADGTPHRPPGTLRAKCGTLYENATSRSNPFFTNALEGGNWAIPSHKQDRGVAEKASGDSDVLRNLMNLLDLFRTADSGTALADSHDA